MNHVHTPYEEIRDRVGSIPVVDTHEHLPPWERLRPAPADWLAEYLGQYAASDAVSAGLSREGLAYCLDRSVPIAARWKVVEPYWERCRNTGYFRSLERAASGLYGIERICGENVEPLRERFDEAYATGRHFHRVLHELCSIDTTIIDFNLECDPTLFRSVYRLDHCIFPHDRAEWHLVRDISGLACESFDEYLAACELVLDHAIARGAVALKIGLAYDRSLLVLPTPKADAADGFAAMRELADPTEWHRPGMVPQPFQDFMFDYLITLAGGRSLTVQIHTGHVEGPGGGDLPRTDPALLVPLVRRHPEVVFDLFHIGYPYHAPLGSMAKMFPNVNINFCWAHILAPATAEQMLYEWLTTVPSNKMSAFGGDYCFVDGVYGHLEMARDSVSRALARHVREAYFSVDDAIAIARRLFHENPARILRRSGPTSTVESPAVRA